MSGKSVGTWLGACGLLAVVAGAAFAEEKVPRIPFEKYVLPNGMRVILHQDRSSPQVAVNLWYYVGSKDEKPGRTGFAHLFEHLMFTGSKHAPYPSFDALLEAWGGSNNATTATDRTNYYEIGPSNLLETFLWLEADRMATLEEAISEDRLTKQRLVVQNERRQSNENRPYGKAQLVIPELLYPPTHPYHWPVIGSHADLEAASVADVREFFRRHYVPANASLVIAGDFDVATAKGLVDRYFAWQPKQAPPPRPSPKPAPLVADKSRDVPDNVQLPRVELVWHSPADFAPGDAEVDIAGRILGGGKSSRLYRSLVYDKRIAQNAMAGQGAAELGGRFRISVTAKPGVTLAQIERAVDEELARFAKEPPTTEEVERARNKLFAELWQELDTLLGRADLLNRYEHALGDPGGLARDIERYRAVTPAAIKTAFAGVVAGKRVVVRTVPEKKSPPAAPAVGKAPAGGTAAPTTPAAPKEAK